MLTSLLKGHLATPPIVSPLNSLPRFKDVIRIGILQVSKFLFSFAHLLFISSFLAFGVSCWCVCGSGGGRCGKT